mgnify:CR=1 FL=1
MVKYVIKRILLAFVTCFIVLSLTYILVNCLRVQKVFTQSNGELYAYYMNMVERGFMIRFDMPMEGYGDLIQDVTVGSGINKITYYFYQTPVMDRYFSWLINIFTKWDWGISQAFQVGAPTMDILLKRLPTTMKINILSVIVSVPLGIGFGVLCALKKGSVFDNIAQVIIMIFISIPGFVIISYCILASYSISWLPSYWPQSTDPTSRKIAAYIIPVIVLSTGSIFGYARFVRAELCEVLESEYLLLARTKGLTRGQAIMRHAFRNAMVPVLPSVVAEFISILGGSMILENLYQIPGVGQLYMAAFNSKDYALLMTDMAFYTIISLMAGIVVDLSYGFIDPRIRMGAKK